MIKGLQMLTSKSNLLKTLIKTLVQESIISSRLIKENFYLIADTERKFPITREILNAIKSKLPMLSKGKTKPEIEASGAEGIVISLDDYRVIKLFFSKENAEKSAGLYYKNVDFTSNVYTAGKILLDVPVIYVKKGSSYSKKEPTQTNVIYYIVMQRVIPDENTYNQVELAYEKFNRLSNIKFKDLEMIKSLEDPSLNAKINEILDSFLTEKGYDSSNLDKTNIIQSINGLDRKEKNKLITDFDLWNKKQTKTFLLNDSSNKPLLLKNFILNDIGAVSTTSFDVQKFKNLLFSSPKFQNLVPSYNEIASLIKKIVIDNKIPWNDIHRGQFGRDKDNKLIALDIGIKSDKDSGIFDTNVSQVSLRGQQTKLIRENNVKKKINFFDFDKTLFDTPGPEEGKARYEKLYNKPYPHIGWISKEESLDPNLDIQPIKSVVQLYRNMNDAGTINVLLSDRLPKMKESIEKLLKIHDINMDFYLLNSGPHKSQRLRNFIENFPFDIEEINLFDDKESVLRSYLSFKSLYDLWESGIKISVFKIDNGKVVKL